MKKLLILLMLLIPAGVLAQTAAITGYCVLGAAQSLTSGLPSSNYLQGVIPQCTVTVYLTGTTTLATIYFSQGGSPYTGPFTANINGSWLFFAAINQGYDVVLSGGIAPNTYPYPVTLTGLYPGTSITIPTAGCIGQNAVVNGCTGASTPTGAVANLHANGPVFNLLTYGGIGDKQQVSDAVYIATNTTVTSASASFTAGTKTAVAEMGPQFLSSVTVNSGITTSAGVYGGIYNSGLTCTGPAGSYVVLNSFNGGGTGAVAIVSLTSTNTINAGSPLGFASPYVYAGSVPGTFGSGYTTSPTTAAVDFGTATCTGTASVTTYTYGACNLSSFNGDSSGATATVYYRQLPITSSDSWTTITNAGSGLTSAPTSAAVSNGTTQLGTNTCSGPASLTTALTPSTVITTLTTVNSTTATLGTAATKSGTGMTLAWGTDNHTAIGNAVAAINTAGGGQLLVPWGSYLDSICGYTFTATTPVNVLGFGPDSQDLTETGSELACASTTANMFTVLSGVASFNHLALVNISNNPTAGNALLGANTTQNYPMLNVTDTTIDNWYNGVNQATGEAWKLQGSWILNSHHCGLVLTAGGSQENGDYNVDTTIFTAAAPGEANAVCISGTGVTQGKWHADKIVQGVVPNPVGQDFRYGIFMNGTNGSDSELGPLSDMNIDGTFDSAIYASNGNGLLNLSNSFVRQAISPTPAISLNNTSGTTIGGSTFRSQYGGPAAVYVTGNATQTKINASNYPGFPFLQYGVSAGYQDFWTYYAYDYQAPFVRSVTFAGGGILLPCFVSNISELDVTPSGSCGAGGAASLSNVRALNLLNGIWADTMSGSLTIDMNDGGFHIVTVNASGQMQLPLNLLGGEPLTVQWCASGSYTVTFSSAWIGVTPISLTSGGGCVTQGFREQSGNVVAQGVPQGGLSASIIYLLPNGATATTQTAGDSSTKVATDAFVSAAVKVTTGTPTVGYAACIKSAGPPVVIGYCSTVVASNGTCTCN